MFRIIIYFLIFYFIYKLVKSFKSSNKKFKVRVKPKFEQKEKMIKCENCGLYSPESSNLVRNGKYFCSEKCIKEYFENEKS